ncbi:MAG: polymer-forming cytoskeletal protein [Ardenticatenaceae bacterium]|nr:polymer-forming cytoskeletal protein [Ardenticatenaceae bacterium]MCB9005005.1 polymer-forming cytoskeletal protein [Ardenticatenaceae bacterium]
MATMQSKQNGRKLFSRSRRQEQWVEITGYRVGVIQLDEPILIGSDAHVVGDVIAPKIQVAGLVHGSTAALDTTILPEGQVWGDIYTSQLQIEPGGKVRGWVCSLNEEAYQQLRLDGIVPEADPVQNDPDIPAEAKVTLRSNAQINVLRQLQNEAASALAARAELEESFDQRLQEVAGETAAKVNLLSEETHQLQTQLTEQQRALEAAQENLGVRETQFERQSDELAIARELLEERNTILDTLRQENETQVQTIADLQVKKAALEERLHNTELKVDDLNKRANSLEMALQANLTHSAEQEDALVRWQELAEATEKRATELETELRKLQFQAEENNRLLDMLQEQRRVMEKEWEKALEELESLRKKETEPLSESSTKLLARIDDMETQLTDMAALQVQVVDLESAIQEQEEQLLWYKASLQTSRHELDQLRQTNGEQTVKLAELEAGLIEQRSAAQKWQHRAEEVRNALQKRERALASLQDEREEMQEAVRHGRLQLEAHEAELERYLQEVHKQGKYLAEARNLLIDRDLALKKAQTKINKQAETIAEFKQVAGERIKQLQIDLGRTKQQLADATAVLARRQRH